MKSEVIKLSEITKVYQLINWFIEKEKNKEPGVVLEVTEDEFCTIRRIVRENRNSFISIIINKKNEYSIRLSSSKVGVHHFVFNVKGDKNDDVTN